MSELDELAADLTTAGVRAGARVAKVVESSSRNVRDTARKLAPRRRLPHYAETITAEVKIEGTSIVAEIGPEKDGQGWLGPPLEKGGADSPPHAHLGPGLDQEGPDFMRSIADAADPLT